MANRILVVEDDTAISELICMNLEVTGYEVVPVLDGNEVEGTLEKEENFDLALLDIMLPDMDGFEVCRNIRATNKQIGIIMLTARTQEMDKVTGLMTGADDYVCGKSAGAYRKAKRDHTGKRSGDPFIRA